jgi:hypothetical protein
MKACPYCGTENPDDADVCSNCSADLKADAAGEGESGAKTVISSSAAAEVEAMVAAAEAAKEAEESAAAEAEEPDEDAEEVDEPDQSESAGAAESAAAATVISSAAAHELEELVAEAERKATEPEESEIEEPVAEEPESPFDRAEAILEEGRGGDSPMPSYDSTMPAEDVAEPKNKALALGLELLGLVMLPGLGWMYAGKLPVGAGILVGSFILNAVFIVLDIFLAPITLLLFLCCHALVIFGVAGASAYFLNNDIKARPDEFI